MTQLAAVLRSWREKKELSVRDAANVIGLKPMTLNRIERGKAMDGQSLGKILRWMLS